MRAGLPPSIGLRARNETGGFTWARPPKPKASDSRESGASADPTVLQLISQPFDTSAPHMAHLRTLWDTRSLLFMHPHDMVARGLAEGDLARVTTVSGSEHLRELACMRVVPYDLPRGSVGGYFPECHALLAGLRQAHASQQPANERIGVRVRSVTA
jgi:anaerobic selenocysteine-containing dehydrogenase